MLVCRPASAMKCTMGHAQSSSTAASQIRPTPVSAPHQTAAPRLCRPPLSAACPCLFGALGGGGGMLMIVSFACFGNSRTY